MNINTSKFIRYMVVAFSILSLIVVGCQFGNPFSYSNDTQQAATNNGFIQGKIVANKAATSNSKQLLGNDVNDVISLPGAEVWIENLPLFSHVYTNASGVYSFVNVPTGKHVVVAQALVNNSLQKARSTVLVVNNAKTFVNAPNVNLESATSFLIGVVRSSKGIPLQLGTILTLWGEQFEVGQNGYFETPLLPNSQNLAEIFIKMPGSVEKTSFIGSFIKGNTPAYVDQVILPSTTSNHAPSAALVCKNSSDEETVKCKAFDKLYLSIIPFDPDFNDIDSLKFSWKTSNGSLQVLNNNKQAIWTAMGTPGVATVSVEVKDYDNATSTASLRLLVDINSISEVDSSGPILTKNSPSNNVTSIDTNSDIVLVFNESLLESSLATDSIMVSIGDNILDGLVKLNNDGKTLVWSPTKRLPFASVINVSTSEYIRDLTGNPIGNSASWSFTTRVPISTSRYASTTQTSSSKSITSFVFTSFNPIITGIIDENFKTIDIAVPFWTDIDDLAPTISHNGVSISPNSETRQDFSDPVVYTVYAIDGTFQDYTVTVTESSWNTKEIRSFIFNELYPSPMGIIDENAKTITLKVPFGTDITILRPTITYLGSSLTPNSGVIQNFSTPVDYTVTDLFRRKKTYQVSVEVSGATSKQITSFNFNNFSPASIGAIDEFNKKIAITVPYGIDLTTLAPTISHTGVSVLPNSQATQNFTSPIDYVITAADGTASTYSVTVTMAANSAKDITEFRFSSLDPEITGTIDLNTRAIDLLVPYGTDISSLIPTISHNGTSISPDPNTPQDFRNTVIYTVAAENATAVNYEVDVRIARNNERQILIFEFNSLTPAVSVVVSRWTSSIDLTVPYGTDVTSLIPTIGYLGFSVEPNSGAAQDFTNTVVYTVTANSGRTKDYNVTVTIAPNTENSILLFEFRDFSPTVVGIIDNSLQTIDLTVPSGTNLTNLRPTITHTGYTLLPVSGVANDFTNPAIYTVTAENGTPKEYTVTVNVELSSAKAITSFKFAGMNPEVAGLIDENRKEILLTVPSGTDVTQLTPSISHTGASCSPTSGTSQNFNNSVAYTVTAEDNSTQEYEVTVSTARRRSNDITSFVFDSFNPSVVGNINTNTNAITLTVPFGTSLMSLTPTIAHTGVNISPNSGAPVNFASTVTYTVTSERGTTQDYYVTVTEAPDNSKSITSFNFNTLTPKAIGIIDENAKTIALLVPYGTNISEISPTITHMGASVSPNSGVGNDFTNPVTYTVSADDGTEKGYSVIVTTKPNPSKSLTSFNFSSLNPEVVGVIDENAKTVVLTVPYGTNVSNIAPVIEHSGTSILPNTLEHQNFTSTVNYIITAADATTQTYRVTVITSQNWARDIVTFNFNTLTPPVVGIINQGNRTIDLTVPYATSLLSITPEIAHTGDSISPNSGSSQNFNNLITYTVTAANGSTKDYDISVSVEPNTSKSLQTFIFEALEVSATIDQNSKIIAIAVPYGTNLAALVPTITHTGSSISPQTNVAQNFTNNVNYTVNAEDGTDQTYTAIVTIAANHEKEITAFNITSLENDGIGVINEVNKTIALTVPYNTDITALTPTITHSGVNISPSSNVAQDFTNTVNYTVTAENGTQKTYAVTLTIEANPAYISSFNFEGLNPIVNGSINENARTISLTVPYGTNKTSLTPTVVFTGNSVSPNTGLAQNFTNPVNYTVTDSGVSNVYTVTVTVAKNPAKAIKGVVFSGSFPGMVRADIREAAGEIDLTVPKGTDITAMSIDISHDGDSCYPNSGSKQNFTNPVKYTITAEDTSTKDYDVSATIDAGTSDYISPNIGTMKVVMGGTFQRDDNAGNTSTVSTFRMSQYEVTQSQYAAITGNSPSWNVEPNILVNNTNRPVEKLTWFDAVEFCNKLSEAEGLDLAYNISGRIPTSGYPITDAAVTLTGKNGYRLPSEAEWQWAAMGATDDRNKAFAGSNGSNNIEDYAWYYRTSHLGANGTYDYYGSHPVGTKLPNEIGLYDMSGNITEWCWDWNSAYDNGALIDSKGPTTGSLKALRGGNWLSKATSCTTAFRRGFLTNMQYDFMGVRVVRN